MLAPQNYKNSTISLHMACIQGLLIGLFTGAIIAFFKSTYTISHTFLLHTLQKWSEYPWIIPLWFSILTLFAWIIGKLLTYEPNIAGSGIPQVELILEKKLTLSWKKILITKFIGSWITLLGGLSLGLEGPCIQMGAATGEGFGRRWFKQQSNLHIIGGAAAGICAAFGAPLAGIFLIFEEMRSPITIQSLLLVCTAVIGSQLMLEYGFNIGRMFDFQNFSGPTIQEIIPLLLTGIILGLTGVLYNIILLWFKDIEAKQTLFPHSLRTLPIFFCAGIFIFLLPEITNGGDILIHHLPYMPPILYPLFIILLLKIFFSAYSYTGNTPGGLLMPILCIGGILGCLTGTIFEQQKILEYTQTNSYIIYAMAGYFSATVRAPLTGIALVTEITGALQCLPGTIFVGFISHITANLLHSPPIYESLKKRIHIQS